MTSLPTTFGLPVSLASPLESSLVTRRLLDRTCNLFSGYGVIAKDRGNVDDTERSRIALRHTIHAAASSEDSHYQNYIRNLSAEPLARQYIAPVYYSKVKGADVVGGGMSGRAPAAVAKQSNIASAPPDTWWRPLLL